MVNETSSIAKEMAEAMEMFFKMDWRKRRACGTRPSELRVLFCIQSLCNQGRHEVSISDISKRLCVTSPTVTQLIKQLIKAGYVQSYDDANDKRMTLLRLTSSGEAVVKQALEQHLLHMGGLVDRLGEEQSEAFIALLRQVMLYFSEIKPLDEE
ncbi:MarR family transcriptional regulator [Paenibacillus oenotherae]|uniref:MarR family transcriptional regulator n=1 Tax=Paenibacillus oenotherae TaxID=1435645 RepID=A0ABS7D214_9BACL|nr:MarR family transcriptional regulator [Paenibacillus oenotherae]MBW7473893.1 MarR family transcriptional regulator [Paenibacillus oenotherae]